MSTGSKILPLIVGAINERESYTSAELKCPPTGSSGTGDPLSSLSHKILFPENTNNILPLIGGSILKVELSNKVLDFDSEHKLISRYDTFLGRFSSKTDTVRKFVEGLEQTTPQPMSKYAELLVKINKTLEDSPFVQNGLHKFMIPSIRLSNIVSPDITDVNKLSTEISRKKEQNARLQGLQSVGDFKFIPIELIKEIYKEIAKDGDEIDIRPFANNAGLSANQLKSVYAAIEGASTGDKGSVAEEDFAKALINILPIFRVDEDFIEGEDSQKNIGYYTVVGKDIYIKTPDLSGRDVSGYSSNIYGVGEDDADYVGYVLEFSMRRSHAFIALDYLAPPQIDVEENIFEAAPTDGKITIKAEGASDAYKYFLSPIYPGGGGVSVADVNRVKSIEDAVEAFTVPSLGKPFFENKDALSLPLFNFSEIIQSTLEGPNNFSEDDVAQYTAGVAGVLEGLLKPNEGDPPEITHESSIPGVVGIEKEGETTETFLIQDFGVSPIPAQKDRLGVTSGSQVLALSNRPDILLGRRDEFASHRRNNRKFFNQKIYASKEIFMSVTPSIIIKEENIPQVFVPSKSAQKISGTDDMEISFSYNTTANNFGLDKFPIDRDVEFALYAMDELGQITRASGENITMKKVEEVALGITPNGTFDHKVIVNSSESDLSFTVAVDSILDIFEITFWSDRDSDDSQIALANGDQFSATRTGSSFNLVFNVPLNEIFGSITGTVWVQINDTKPRLQLYISDSTIVSVDQLPGAEPNVVKFEDPDGLKAKKFGKSINSIPVLMDGSTNAEITLKYTKKIFEDDSEIYAYLAINKVSGDNEKILTEDINFPSGFVEDGGGIYETSINGSPYLVPLDLEWKFGSDSFYKLTRKKCVLKFPGPASGRNLSRFSKLAGTGSLAQPGYLILSNKRLNNANEANEDGYRPINLVEQDHVMIKLGSKDDPNLKMFVNPPYVKGLAAKLPGAVGGGSYVFTNAGWKGLVDQKYTKGIPDGEINVNTISGIIASDALSRLSIAFEGSANEPRISRAYKAYLGNTKLKKYRVGRVQAKDVFANTLVLNYKNISSIKDSGWTTVTISKKDRRFNTTYDSTVYNVASIKFSCGEPADPNCSDDGVLKEGSSSDIQVLRSGSDKRSFEDIIEATEFEFDESASIFPEPESDYSILPYRRTGTETEGVLLEVPPNKRAQNKASHVFFSNPIKIKPSVELVMGQQLAVGSSSKVFGTLLTDTNAQDFPHGEIVTFSTNGSTYVPPNLSALSDAVSGIQEQVAGAVDNAKGALDEINAQLDEMAENDPRRAALESQAQEIEEATTGLEDANGGAASAISDAEAAEAQAAQQALEAGGETGEGSGALDDAAAALEDAAAAAQAAADAAKAAAAAVEAAAAAALAAYNAFKDLISSFNMIAQQLENALSSFGPRDDEFYGTSIGNIFISKDSAIQASSVRGKADGSEYRLDVKVKFEQTAAIKFNSPEIVSIDYSGKTYAPPSFGDIIVESKTPIILKTIGTNRGTKVEVNSIRVPKKIVGELGIFKDLQIELNDLANYTFIKKCITISLTNDNENRLLLDRQLGNDLAINLDTKWDGQIFGGKRNKQGRPSELREKAEQAYLKFTSVTLDKVNIAKEFMQSFCDMSFHLTAELALQLRNFKVLLIPIKVILCIIDVICALLNPIRLAFAIIRLFLCLYDLILLLPPLSVPAMLLALILHILELLLCVIIKLLGIVNAINEIIAAFQLAIEEKDYPAIMALEETINEHIFSLEADLSVLEPILAILGMFLELLELLFAFPCQVGSDADDDMQCIDSSQLAGIILGKVAPAGRIEPDALLPLAQTYTTRPAGQGTIGNTPEQSIDPSDVLKEVSENAGEEIVKDNSSFGGRSLTGLRNSATGELLTIEDGGFFSGDLDEDGRQDNVGYDTLRFGDGDFDATFGISFTKSKKAFSIFTGPDPRIVQFEFKEKGKTNSLAFNWFLQLFFKKKTIDELQTLDSPPGFLNKSGSKLKVNSGTGGFVSPVDGAADVVDGSWEGFFLNKKGSGYQPKPLTITFELNEPGINPDNLNAEFTPVTVTKTFPGIPMIALVDDEFNVYFVEETGDGGGIELGTEGGAQVITSINAKMINFPSAPKLKFSKEDLETYRRFADMDLSSSRATDGDWQTLYETDDVEGGKVMVYEQANANFLLGETLLSEYAQNILTDDGDVVSIVFNAIISDMSVLTSEGYPNTAQGWADALSEENAAVLSAFGIVPADVPGTWPAITSPAPFPDYEAYDWANGGKKTENDFGEAIDLIKVFDFPRLYIVDMRHLADDIASACGASGPSDLLFDLHNFSLDGTNDAKNAVNNTISCVEKFRNFYLSEELDENGIPIGHVPRMKLSLANGEVPDPVPVQDCIGGYDDFRACLEAILEDTCELVINPLNTSFKLMQDEDETPLPDFIDPEQQDLANLISYDIVDELEFDDELAGFPKITGAMEYASGVGDTAIVKAGEKALVKIIPRDCYDDILPPTLDLREKIKIDFVQDGTEGAEVVTPYNNTEDIFLKEDGEYTFAVTAPTPGMVKIRATVCSVVVQAVTDRSLVTAFEENNVEVDCIEDVTAEGEEEEELFAPGQLTKVDRVLTILFVADDGSGSGNYGDDDRDNNAKSAIPSPQTFGTKLEN